MNELNLVAQDRAQPVVAYLGAHGGAGTTRSAVRLAQRVHAARTRVLVDLDLWTGDLGERAGLAARPITTIADVSVLAPDSITADHVAAITWPTSTLRNLVVPSPRDPELAEIVSASHVAAVIDVVRQQHAVIIDLGSRFDERSLAACMRADQIIVCAARASMILTPGVGAVVDVLLRAGVSPGKIVGRITRPRLQDLIRARQEIDVMGGDQSTTLRRAWSDGQIARGVGMCEPVLRSIAERADVSQQVGRHVPA